MKISGVLIKLAALSPESTKIPAAAEPPPRLIEVPPLSVMATLFWKVMLLAACAPLMVTVPVVPVVPAEKKTSLVAVVVDWKAPAEPPSGSVFQKLLVPQVPVAAPEPAVVPLVSQ